MAMFGMSPEDAAKLEQMQADHRDMFKSQMHQIDAAWDSLTEEQLQAISTWFFNLSMLPEEVQGRNITYMSGIIDSLLRSKFGICVWDNEKHDDQADDFLKSLTPESNAHTAEPIGTPTDQTLDEWIKPSPDIGLLPETEPPLEPVKLPGDYDLQRNPFYPSDPQAKPWVCTKCNYGWATIHERANHDICLGCAHKSKFG